MCSFEKCVIGFIFKNLCVLMCGVKYSYVYIGNFWGFN